METKNLRGRARTLMARKKRKERGGYLKATRETTNKKCYHRNMKEGVIFRKTA